MKKSFCGWAIVCAALAGVAWADVTVGTGETLVYTNALTFPNGTLTLADGATFKVTAPDASKPGFDLVKQDDSNLRVTVARLTAPQIIFQPEGAKYSFLDVPWATNLQEAVVGNWIYTARWYVPETADYSFFEAIDDGAAVTIDGNVVLARVSMPTECSVASNVTLAAGWHDLQIDLANGGSSRNPLGCRSGYAKGLVFSSQNLAFTKENCCEGSTFADPGDGSLLRRAANGTFNRRVWIPEGTATLDLSESDLVNGFRFYEDGLRTGEGAKLRVAGGSRISIGSRSLDVHYPLLDADVEFPDAGNGEVHLAGQVSVKTLRPNYVIDPGSEVAYWGANMVDDPTLWLTNRSAYVLNTAAFAPTTKIVVGEGQTLTVKPCTTDASGWRWSGIEGVFSNDVELAGGRLSLRGYRNLKLTGRLSGEGEIYSYDAAMGEAPCCMGDLSGFTGLVHVVNGPLRIASTTPGAPMNTVHLENRGSFTLRPAGAPEVPSAVYIHHVVGGNTNTCVSALDNQVLTIGTVEGHLSLANGTDSGVVVSNVAANTSVRLLHGVDATFMSYPDSGWLRVEERGLKVTARFPEGGNAAVLDVPPGSELTVHGDFRVGRVQGGGTVYVAGHVCVLKDSDNTRVVALPGGTVSFNDGATLGRLLGDFPALWLDASQTNTWQQYLPGCCFTNGPVIRRWNDCRPQQTALYGLNARGDGYTRVLPYVMTNALAGKCVVSMGKVGGTIANEYGHISTSTLEPVDGPRGQGTQPETRRLPFSHPIRAQTMIAVFGSQFGGGKAFVGGCRESNWPDLRGDESTTFEKTGATDVLMKRGDGDVNNPATPMFNVYRETYLNGEAVDPTTAGYNGGWQVVSTTIGLGGRDVRGLGMYETYQDSGGQNWAELLVFTNALSQYEQRCVEAYLSAKWRISGCGSWEGALEVASNSVQHVADGAQVLNGNGTVQVSGTFAPEGCFSGTLALDAGARLELGLSPLPPTADDVPAAGRFGWFDPDDAADVDFGTDVVGREHALDALYNHGQKDVADSLYLHGTFNIASVGNSGDRRPYTFVESRGYGPARRWMHFWEPDETWDKGGNTLRFKTNHAVARKHSDVDYSNVSRTAKTAFVVMDSCKGGGQPFMDTVGGTGTIKRRAVNDALSPIYATGSTAALTNGETRLNGVRVPNGFVDRFTGGPELLSLTSAAGVPLAFFGSCGTGVGERSYEIMGEILLYDAELGAEDRATVEAYLMAKWLGVAGAGYSDLRRATVTGAGTVASTDAARLPSFDAGFTGMVELSQNAYAFTVDAAATPQVADAVVVPGSLTVPATGTVAVSITGKARPGTYPLVTCGSIAGDGFDGWTLVQPEGAKGRLVATETGVAYVLAPTGTVLMVR